MEILLPYPDEKCVNSPVLLPRVSCQQVEDRHCMAVPVVREGLTISVTKCGVTYEDEECLESTLSLPRQACPTKVGLDSARGNGLLYLSLLDDEHQERLRVC